MLSFESNEKYALVSTLQCLSPFGVKMSHYVISDLEALAPLFKKLENLLEEYAKQIISSTTLRGL